MTLDEIKQLVSAGESETLEFKATTGQRGPAAKTVCAMLNTRGGYVLFGVKPDGTIAGQKVGGQTLDDVSAEIRNIDPLFAPTINRVRVALGKEVISLRVDTEKRRRTAVPLRRQGLLPDWKHYSRDVDKRIQSYVA